MDPSQEEIQQTAEQTGLEPREAEAFIYLWRAEGIFQEIYSEGKGVGGTMFMGTQVTPHFHALRNILSRKIVARQYPEGWAMQFEDESGAEEEE